MGFVVALIFIGAVALFAYLIGRHLMIRKNGIVAEAVITSVKEAPGEEDDDGNRTMHLIYHVRFKAQDGTEIEARLGDEPKGLAVGDTVSIQYLPNKPKFVILAK